MDPLGGGDHIWGGKLSREHMGQRGGRIKSKEGGGQTPKLWVSMREEGPPSYMKGAKIKKRRRRTTQERTLLWLCFPVFSSLDRKVGVREQEERDKKDERRKRAKIEESRKKRKEQSTSR